MKAKNNGIDERQIKCACNDENCSQTGISFESTFNENHLRFHFKDYLGAKSGLLYQRTKSMVLNKQTTNELIKQLKQLKFK